MKGQERETITFLEVTSQVQPPSIMHTGGKSLPAKTSIEKADRMV